MTVMRGETLRASGIILNGVTEKVDDNQLPSYGMDGALYTFRASPLHGLDNRFYLLPQQSLVLQTLEQVWIPHNCVGLLWPKSTYTRQGVMLVTNSPVDPGYKGPLTIRFYNTHSAPVLIYLDGGLMQMTVHMLDDDTLLSYKGRWG